jgi:prepilin-type N-terminal cleavage/methylation domain-containing protein
MISDNIKLKQKDHGFTIVELLVVIVVIGILAAITIVSYTGITAKANTSKSQSNAQAVQSVAEAYNADNGYYPGTLAAFTTGSASTHLPSGVSVIADAAVSTMTSAASNTGTVVAYSCLSPCSATGGTTGGRIAYWNFNSPAGIVYIYVGAGTPTSTWVYPSAT